MRKGLAANKFCKLQFLKENYQYKYFCLIAVSIVWYIAGNFICPAIDTDLIEAVLILFTLGTICFFLGRDCQIITRNHIGQIFVIATVMVLFWDAALFSAVTSKTEHIILVIEGTIIINYLWLLCAFIYFRKWEKVFDKKKFVLYSIIFFLFFIGNFVLIKSPFSLDGYIYYADIRSISKWDFCGIYKLQLCGHISAAYSCLMLIGEFIVPENIMGVRMIHIIFGCITIYAFGKIVESITSNRVVQTICTVFFAFSPIVYGTVLDINLDYALFCFFIWFVSCYIHKKYILMIFCGLCVCYTKEVGCVLFGAFFIGIFIEKLLMQIKDMESIWIDLRKIPNLIFIAIGVVWIITYVFRDASYWMTTVTMDELMEGARLNTFSFDREYIVHKLKEMLFINFSWLFLLVSGVLFIVGKKLKLRRDGGEIPIFPMKISCLAYMIFNALYFTWTHYRYMNLVFFFFVVFMINTVHRVIKDTVGEKIIFVLTGTLIIISSFFTADPFTAPNFMTFKTSSGNLAILGSLEEKENGNYVINKNNKLLAALDNATLYNNQLIYFKHCINKVFDKINYDADKLVVIPRKPGDEGDYGTLRTIFASCPFKTDVMYWDVAKEKLELELAKVVDDNDRYQRVNIKCIRDISELSEEEMERYDEIYFWGIELYKNNDSQNILHQETNQFPMIGQARTVGWCWDIYQLK